MAYRRRNILRFLFAVSALLALRWFLFSPSTRTSTGRSASRKSHSHRIQERNFIQRATGRSDKSLNVQKHRFLQARMGRDDREGIMADTIASGMWDWWERFQLPYITDRETSNMDAQHVVSSVDQLLSWHGWVAALCPSLIRPFSHQNKHGLEEGYADLIKQDHLYYVAIVIHSADHFLVDQLAVIVQMAKRLGTQNLFVSMLDYASTDSTETLTDLCEAVLTLLGVPFRIRRVVAMTHDPKAAYYPLEEAYARNLALEPLTELKERRGVTFKRVVWLKGFTCPNDIFETIQVSLENEAAMVCGMDWAEKSGKFYFSDRWRTRDIDGDQFRQASSKGDSVPPRDQLGASRYAQHLPFQVFCCESGTHVVDPVQSYYRGISYRAGTDFHNISVEDTALERGPDSPCLDSSQLWFCRDLWVRSAKDGLEEVHGRSASSSHPANSSGMMGKREVLEIAANDQWMRKRDVAAAAEEAKIGVEAEDAAGVNAVAEGLKKAMVMEKGPAAEVAPAIIDPDANAGSDYDAIPVDQGGEVVPAPAEATSIAVSNSGFRPARIMVNPRCVTTYAGVSHTQLAQDLFGDADDAQKGVKKYLYEKEWESAPDSFVCQEQADWWTGGDENTEKARIFNS